MHHTCIHAVTAWFAGHGTHRRERVIERREPKGAAMILLLIVLCEAGFWVVLLCGLLARYVLRWRRGSVAVLLLLPCVDVVLLVATLLDLRRVGTAGPSHALAASYLAVTVVYGHRIVARVDARFAHRFDGAPMPDRASHTGGRRPPRWSPVASKRAGLGDQYIPGGIGSTGRRRTTPWRMAAVVRRGLVRVCPVPNGEGVAPQAIALRRVRRASLAGRHRVGPDKASWSTVGSVQPHRAGGAIDGDDLSGTDRRSGAGDADHGGYAVFTGHHGAVGVHAAGVE